MIEEQLFFNPWKIRSKIEYQSGIIVYLCLTELLTTNFINKLDNFFKLRVRGGSSKMKFPNISFSIKKTIFKRFLQLFKQIVVLNESFFKKREKFYINMNYYNFSKRNHCSDIFNLFHCLNNYTDI